MTTVNAENASIIIPCFNCERSVTATLKALDRQTARGFDVVAVDDGSTDGTVAALRSFKPKNYKLTVIAAQHAGPAVQRNRGATAAKNSILLFTDSDCAPEGNWVEEMLKPFDDPAVVGVSGTYRTLNTDRVVSRFEGYEIAKRHERLSKRQSIDFIATAYAAYRKSVFVEFGGFSTEFRKADAEDPELSFKIAEAGRKMVFNPNAVVAHPHVSTLGGFWRQKFSRGYWRVLLYKVHPEKLRGDSYTGIEVPLSLAAMAGLVLSPLALLLSFDAWLFFALCFFVIFCLANFPTLAFMVRREKNMLFIAPPLMLFRTLAWGMGFAAGLFDFYARRVRAVK